MNLLKHNEINVGNSQFQQDWTNSQHDRQTDRVTDSLFA